MKKLIYFDNNATTQIDPEVLDAMMPFLTNQFANSASTHQFGLQAAEAVKIARKQIADFIGCDSTEVVFTSGSTEAINLAIKGVAEMYKSVGKHIITLKTEHHAVLDSCEHLERNGYEITYLDVDRRGLLNLEKLRKTLRQDTILVCIMFANNETGIIQDIKGVSQIVQATNAIFMTDATQAVGKVDVNVEDLQIDLMPLSGHKIYGPKGVGALYFRQRRPRKVKLQTFLHGGGHEKGIRSGTLNVPGIVGLGKACEIAARLQKTDAKRIIKLKSKIVGELLKIDGAFINGDFTNSLPNTINVCIPGIDSDALIMGLSNAEGKDNFSIAVSNGSACTAASIEPSHVLVAMGLSEDLAFNSIRISLGRFNTEDEIDIALQMFKDQIENLRSFQKNI